MSGIAQVATMKTSSCPWHRELPCEDDAGCATCVMRPRPDKVREEVLMLAAHPAVRSTRQIARMLGVSHSRPHQILSGEGAKRFRRRNGRATVACPLCGAVHTTRRCYGKLDYGKPSKLYCSSQHRWLDSRIKLICDGCGQPFYRLKSAVHTGLKKGYRHAYHSRECFRNRSTR